MEQHTSVGDQTPSDIAPLWRLEVDRPCPACHASTCPTSRNLSRSEGTTVHLWVTHSAHGQVANVMQSPWRRDVRSIQVPYHHTGAHSDGGNKAGPVASHEHVLRSCLQIELKPVRAAECEDPAQCEFSSFGTNPPGRAHPRLATRASYLGVGIGGAGRPHAYAYFTRDGISDVELKVIREHRQRQPA